MSSNPLVSVVITAYNSQATIAETIDSILIQSYQPIEIIVVDDGSSDQTAQIIEEQYADKVNYIFQENQGSAVARNTGIENSRGEFIALLDGDDVATYDRIARQADVMMRSDATGVVYGNIYTMGEHGENLKERKGLGRYKSGNVLKDLILKNFVPFSTVMVRRAVIDKAGLLNCEIRSSEDWEWLIRLSKVTEFQFTQGNPIVKYRIMPTGKTANVYNKEVAYARVQKVIFDGLSEQDQQKYKPLSNAALNMGMFSICLRYKYYGKAFKHLLKSLFEAPQALLLYRYEISGRLLRI